MSALASSLIAVMHAIRRRFSGLLSRGGDTIYV
jgi:hypothetical protein